MTTGEKTENTVSLVTGHWSLKSYQLNLDLRGILMNKGPSTITLSLVLFLLVNLGVAVTLPGCRTKGEKEPDIELMKPGTSEYFVREGNRKLEQGNFPAAADDFDKALEKEPGMAPALSGKKIVEAWYIFWQDNDDQKALATFNKAIAEDPSNAILQVQKGIALLQLGEIEAAQKAFQTVTTDTDPKYYYAWLELGAVFAEQGEFEQAFAAFDQAKAIEPDNPLVWIYQGDAFAAQGKLDRAIKSYDRAIEINPEAVDAWVGKGTVLRDQEKPQQALTHFEKALIIEPKNIRALSGKSQASLKNGKTKEAIAAADLALALWPNWPGALTDKANALLKEGNTEQALDLYTEALKHSEDPNDYILWSNQAEALNKLGRHEEALKAANQAVTIETKSLEGWYQLREALRRLKDDYVGAISAYDNALAIDPNYHYAWQGKGEALAKIGQHQEALKAFDKVLGITPGDIALQKQSIQHHTWNEKGKVLHQLERYGEALAAYNKAIEIKEDFASAWYSRGWTYVVLGQKQEAEADFQKAEELNPSLTPPRRELDNIGQ